MLVKGGPGRSMHSTELFVYYQYYNMQVKAVKSLY